jgi:hypothetical protein
VSQERGQDEAGAAEREDAIGTATSLLLAVQRDQGFPAPGPVVAPFWDRPYRHINPAIVSALSERPRP